MTDVKPQAYACIVDGVFEDVFRRKIFAEQLVYIHAKEGVVFDILPLYTVDEVGLAERDAEIAKLTQTVAEHATVLAEQCQRIKNLKARAHDHLALLGVERNRALKAEQERDALRAQLISEWDMDEIPTFRQGGPIHEMEGIVTAEQVTGYVKRIAELREQVRVLNEALTELMKYTPRTVYVGGPDNGYLRPAGTELLKVLDKCDAALTAVRESTSSPAGEGGDRG